MKKILRIFERDEINKSVCLRGPFLRFILLGCLFIIALFNPLNCRAMPPGSLVYRTSGQGRMYGYSGDPLIYSEKGIIKNINSGHAGIYIGKENGVEYVVEALSSGIVKTPADKFVNLAEGEKYLGAKIPKNLSAMQQAKVVAIAKSLVGQNLTYDFDFKTQKGPESGEWTCVGLTEKLYESANISNPNNLESLEYDPNYYALDITPDGFDNDSNLNEAGDSFSTDVEYSRIARRSDLLIPAPELIGYNVGLEKNGSRYIFIPYTQFLQPSLSDVKTDISMSSSFNGTEVRGAVPTAALVLRWSLINNPLSSLKTIASKTKDLALSLKDKLFGGGNSESEIVLTDNIKATTSGEEVVKNKVLVNKADSSKIANVKNTDKKTTVAKPLSPKTNNIKTADIDKADIKKAATKSATEKVVAGQKNTVSSTSSAVKIASYYQPVSNTIKAPATISTQNSPITNSPGAAVNASANSSANVQTATVKKVATISKIYATASNDFIELSNPGNADFDLAEAGYRLEKAKTAEDPGILIRIGDTEDGSFPGGTIIKAHGKYLIVFSGASNFYLAKADAIATRNEFSWPNSGYTIYLGTGSISSSADSDIVEAIGFGPDATYYQGANPAVEIKDNYVLSRQKSTGNNNLDFELIKSDDPGINWSLGTNNTATSTEDVATSTEGVATSTEGVATSTEGVATSTENIASSTHPEILGSAIINKIYGTGDNDWIELFNPTQSDLDLSLATYRLEKSKTAEDPALIMRIGDPLDGIYPGGNIIHANGKYLIVSSDANDYYKSKADAIATRTDFSWFNSDYTLYLGNGPISSSTDENIVDKVGFGTEASFWQGSGPAPALINNYYLNRIASTKNNNFDFNLLPADDPSINWSDELVEIDNTSRVYNFSPSSSDLFVFPEIINENDLAYLWHFDECSGERVTSNFGSGPLLTNDVWSSGKFGCAKMAGYEYGNISGALNVPLDINNFTLSFWFKATMDSPRLSLSLGSSYGDGINMTLEQDLMQFSGLANPDWRYYGNFTFDGTWRQATLVVNRNAGYWSLYVDGIEKIHINSYKLYPLMDFLEIGGNNGPFAIDELAIIKHALTPQEVIDLYDASAPYNPMIYPSSQKNAILKHFWNFNEGIGSTSVDLIGTANINMNLYAWLNTDVNESCLISTWDKPVEVNFPALSSPDLSLTFLWRPPDAYNGHRVRIALKNSTTQNILAIIPSVYVSGFNFNGAYSYFSYGENLTIPYDNNWHRIGLVYDSYRHLLRFYVDGEEKGTRDFIWPRDRPLADALEIISENGLSLINDLGIWEGALSPAQIQEIH